MSFGIWQRTITDDAGNVLPGATIEVREPSADFTGSLVSLFSNEGGTTGLSNPFNADGEGFAQFYAAPRKVDIRATGSGSQRTWRNVEIFGTAATADTGTASGEVPLNSDLGTAATQPTSRFPYVVGSVAELASVPDGLRVDGQLAVVGGSFFEWKGSLQDWQSKGVIDSTAFDIFPDTGEDYSDKIEDFINFCASKNLIAYFRSGQYNINTDVAISASDTAIFGDGKRKTVFFHNTTNQNFAVFRFAPGSSGISDIMFKGFSIQGTADSGTGIQDPTSRSVSRVLFDDVHIDTPNRSCMFFGDTTAGGLSKFAIINCEFESSGVNTYNVAFRKKCEGLIVEGSKFTLSNSGSFNNLAIYADTTRFIVKGNEFFGGGHSPVACSPANNGVITANIIDNNLFTQISAEGGIELEWKDGHQGVDTTHDIIATDNIIRGYHWGVFALKRDNLGANPQAPYNITIANNIILDSDNHSARFEECSNVKFFGNHVFGGSSSITMGAVTGLLVAYNTLNLLGSGFVAINKGTFPDKKGSQIKIIHNEINIDGSRRGIEFNSDGTVQHEFITISDNIIKSIGSFTVPIKMENARRFSVSGNIINQGADGITIDCGVEGRSIAVNGNNISQVAGSAILVNSAGGNLSVKHNEIRGAGAYGVDVFEALKGASISANSIEETVLSVIRIRSTCQPYGRVGENTIINSSDGYGVNMEANNWLVTGNIVDETFLAPVNDTGTSNLVSNNKVTA